jgi:hypothetical protein
MTRFQAFLIALSIGFAVVAGTYAAMQTTKLGTGATTHVSATSITQQAHALDRTAVALKRALHKHPPKLPAVPKAAPAAPHVVYVQTPAPRTAVAAPAPVHHHDDGSGGDGGGRSGEHADD